MKYKHLIAALLVSTSMVASTAYAGHDGCTASGGKHAEWREKWEAATPEERAAMKEKRHARMEAKRAKWEAASPEEQAKMKAEKEAKWKARYDSASPEEKKCMQERKAEWDAKKAKYDAASPEEKAKMRAAWKTHHEGKHGVRSNHGPGSGGAPAAATPQVAPKP